MYISHSMINLPTLPNCPWPWPCLILLAREIFHEDDTMLIHTLLPRVTPLTYSCVPATCAWNFLNHDGAGAEKWRGGNIYSSTFFFSFFSGRIMMINKEGLGPRVRDMSIHSICSCMHAQQETPLPHSWCFWCVLWFMSGIDLGARAQLYVCSKTTSCVYRLRHCMMVMWKRTMTSQMLVIGSSVFTYTPVL